MTARMACVLLPALAVTAVAAGQSQRTVSGQLAQPDAWKALGHHGVLLIRSAARWEDVQKRLVSLGWDKPAKHPVDGVDFAIDQIVCVFKHGDVADRFACRRLQVDGDAARLDLVMSYVIYKKRAAVENRTNFLLVAVPRSKSLTVTVSTYHPMNGGPHPTPEKAQLEWRHTFPEGAGDLVDGLRGVIRAEKPTVPAGQDIRVEFRLEFDNAAAIEPWHFARKLDAAYVWDGKYSNGYRNHAFLVETPDGEAHFLRRPVQGAWDKNAPHPVRVELGKPYVLPEWFEGKTFKSLKALGLDTTRPGTYRITGLYLETAGETKDWRDGQNVPIWGGALATNTLEIAVK